MIYLHFEKVEQREAEQLAEAKKQAELRELELEQQEALDPIDLARQERQRLAQLEKERKVQIEAFRLENKDLVESFLVQVEKGKETLRSHLSHYSMEDLDKIRQVFLVEADYRRELVRGIEADFRLQMLNEVLKQIDVVLVTSTSPTNQTTRL